MKLKTLPVCKLKLRSELDNCFLGRLPPAGLGFRLGLELGEDFPRGQLS